MFDVSLVPSRAPPEANEHSVSDELLSKQSRQVYRPSRSGNTSTLDLAGSTGLSQGIGAPGRVFLNWSEGHPP